MTTVTTLDERIAKAKVKALSEGVRVSLIESTETYARYVAMSTTHPGIAYQVYISISEGSNRCDCPAGSRGIRGTPVPCKHLASAEMLYSAQLELADAKHAREATEISQEQRDKLERELAEIGL